MSERKPILCLDFDGVIHSYASGWQGAAVIPDPPVPGAMEFIIHASERFRVCIFSSRSRQPGGIDAMKGWLRMYLTLVMDTYAEADEVFARVEWPDEKPPALVTIDDRAITFTGDWPSLDEIAAFQPWNKRNPVQTEAFVPLHADQIGKPGFVRLPEDDPAGPPQATSMERSDG